MVDLVSLLLTKHGFSVFQAHNGQEALDLVLAEKPKFLVLDLDMPVKTGWGLLADLQGRRPEGLYILILSNHENPEMHQRLKELGANHVITKPFDPAHFIEGVSDLCQRGVL